MAFTRGGPSGGDDPDDLPPGSLAGADEQHSGQGARGQEEEPVLPRRRIGVEGLEGKCIQEHGPGLRKVIPCFFRWASAFRGSHSGFDDGKNERKGIGDGMNGKVEKGGLLRTLLAFR